MPYIQKRGSNTYRISVSNGYDREGKKILERKTIKLDPDMTEKQQRKEAERLAADFEMEVTKGSYVHSNLTFEDFSNQWLIEYAEKRLEKTTIESYKDELRTKI